MKVMVNPPKTPVTKGSMGIAMATIPNVRKMPGPPAPFVPVPLPNIGKSGDSPKGYSKKVKIEGKAVAIKGATFKSMGDIASKGTGGGLISANTHGPTKFVGPGSLDTKIEGKNVQLLGDPMLNNCGGSGSPPNSATLAGVLQIGGLAAVFGDEDCPLCGKAHGTDGKLEETTDTQGQCDVLKAAADAAIVAAAAERKAIIAKAKAEAKAKLLAEAAKWDTKAATAAAAVPERVVQGWRDKAAALRAQDPREPSMTAASFNAMMGVVACECKKIYAGFSMEQFTDVQAKMPGAWHTPKAYTNILGTENSGSSIPGMGKFMAHVQPSKQAKFEESWKHCRNKNIAYNDGTDTTEGSFMPPGQCAAQQMVLLAMDHQCRPVGLTERWYNGSDPTARFMGDLRVRDMKSGAPAAPRPTKPGEFGGKDAVPPCGSCQVILEALMCTEDNPTKCDHKPAKKDVCKKCG